MAEAGGGRFTRDSSVHEGSAHWWWQRITSVALAPLALWLGFSLAFLPSLERDDLLEWMGVPYNAAPLAVFLLVAAYHTVLGLNVIIEDYVHSAVLKMTSKIFLQLLFFLLVIIGLLAVVKVVAL